MVTVNNCRYARPVPVAMVTGSWTSEDMKNNSILTVIIHDLQLYKAVDSKLYIALDHAEFVIFLEKLLLISVILISFTEVMKKSSDVCKA